MEQINPRYPTSIQAGRSVHIQAVPDQEFTIETIKTEPTWLRALRAVCYAVVIITCIALLFALYDLYSLIGDIREAASSWVNGITGADLMSD